MAHIPTDGNGSFPSSGNWVTFLLLLNYFVPVGSSAKHFPLSALGNVTLSSSVHLILTADRIKKGKS